MGGYELEAGWRVTEITAWHKETAAEEKAVLREGLVDRGHLNVFLYNI